MLESGVRPGRAAQARLACASSSVRLRRTKRLDPAALAAPLLSRQTSHRGAPAEALRSSRPTIQSSLKAHRRLSEPQRRRLTRIPFQAGGRQPPSVHLGAMPRPEKEKIPVTLVSGRPRL